MSAEGNRRKASAHVRSYPNCHYDDLRQQNVAACHQWTQHRSKPLD
jgi:hypothetical protein